MIGFGSEKQGTCKVHGNPLGVEDGAHAKRVYGYDYPEFTVPSAVYDLFKSTFAARGSNAFAAYAKAASDYQGFHPSDYQRFKDAINGNVSGYLPSMTSIVKNQYQALNERFQNLKKRGFFANPALIYQQKLEDLQKTKERFLLDIDNANKLRQQEVSALKGRLNALSPYGVLGRGYSITSDSNGKILDSIEGVAPGEIVKTQLKDGIIQASVVSKEKKHAEARRSRDGFDHDCPPALLHLGLLFVYG